MQIVRLLPTLYCNRIEHFAAFSWNWILRHITLLESVASVLKFHSHEDVHTPKNLPSLDVIIVV